ncbi:hypothetical protein V5799_003392 [Amblyomma americanum]|uniref:TIR domain-containing protein n=1 Tax=Amblyomma americanum TaxID=6943 RepID=A0AAQ4D938_AMBAM
MLDLKENWLSVLPGPEVFGNLQSLKSLYLSFNKVRTLEPPVTGTPVRFIDLSNNLISNWTPPLFSLMGSLDTLNLSSNAMYTIDDDMLHDLQNIGTIDVSNGSWDCDNCLLRNLQILLNSSARASADVTFCTVPEMYAGLKVEAVEWNEVKCTPLDLYALTPLLLRSASARTGGDNNSVQKAGADLSRRIFLDEDSTFRSREEQHDLVTDEQRSVRCLKMLLIVALLFTPFVAGAMGIGGALPCRPGTNYSTQLFPLKHCRSTVLQDGRVKSSCKLLIAAPPENWFIPSDPEIMTLEEVFISDTPVTNQTTSGENMICMGLAEVDIEKWDDFPLSWEHRYDIFPISSSDALGPISIYSLLLFIQHLKFKVIFHRPVDIASVHCSRSNSSQMVLPCDVYGFADRFIEYNPIPGNAGNASAIALLFALIRDWNLNDISVEKVNVTFIETVRSVPDAALRLISSFRIGHIVFYKSNIRQIKQRDIAHMRYLEALEFYHCPISRVHPYAFDLIPDIKNISLVGTKLASVPEAVFSQKRLHRLNMAATKVPWNRTFELCPEPCAHESSAEELVLAGTHLGHLKDREFCAFPALQFLDISGCSIREMHGSPFACLQNLRGLDMRWNKVKWITGTSYRGLERLEILSLKYNALTTFPGTEIFGNLPSLKLLSVSANRIKRLALNATELVPVTFLDLSKNFISNWTSPMFSVMRSLHTVILASNQLYTINNDMLRDLAHVQHVDICYNPWDCGSCLLNNLHSLLNGSAKKYEHCIVCKEPESCAGIKAVDVEWNSDVCGPLDYYVFVGVPLLMSVLGISVVSYVVYIKRWYLMYALLYLRAKIKNYKRQSQVGRFLWDAFVCYHVSDSCWVRNVLLARMESPPMSFRFCFAERDFIPGIPIAENICRCISQSRVSLFVVTAEFCKSSWCMFELRLAQHRLFESDREEHIIFIKKSHIEDSDMSPMLSYLTRSRTYIEVPPAGSDDRLQDLFWLQLQMALQQ